MPQESTTTAVSNKGFTFQVERQIIPREQLSTFLEQLVEKSSCSITFRTMLAVDARIRSQHFILFILLLFSAENRTLELEVLIPENDPTYPSITSIFPGADWSEREIHDLFGIAATGGNMEPLVLHRDWPREKHLYPMRHDFDTTQHVPIHEPALIFNQPQIPGSHQVAVGPIHAGIIEPGHLRFTATGEKIHQFDAQLFYTHKGIEKIMEGKSLDDGLTLAEHACGMCAYSHSTAYCMAVETLASMHIPRRAVFIRTILLEMERLANHLWDLTAINAAGGFPFGAAQAARFREQFMQWNQHLTGHRFFRNFNKLGGLSRDIGNETFAKLLIFLDQFRGEFDTWEKLILGHDGLFDRLDTTGILTRELVEAHSFVGPTARGSGIVRDTRIDLPYAAYTEYQPQLAIYVFCDAMARARVRIEELKESVRLIERLIKNLPNGPIHEVLPDSIPAFTPVNAAVESAKGELIHWLMLDDQQRISRWHMRSAPYMNWRAVVMATMGNNIIPDGPLVNKSFNLCYSCSDK